MENVIERLEKLSDEVVDLRNDTHIKKLHIDKLRQANSTYMVELVKIRQSLKYYKMLSYLFLSMFVLSSIALIMLLI